MTTLNYITKTLTSYLRTIILSLLLAIILFVSGSYIIFNGFADDPSSPNTLSQQLLSKQGYHLSPASKKILTEHHIWLMVLDKEGNIQDSYQLPASLKRQYQLTDIAKASRWYLDDYPVFTYVSGDKLLLLGYPKNSYARLPSNYFQLENFYKVCLLLLVIIVFLLLFFFLLMLRARLRIKKEITPIQEALENLSKQEPLTLAETGNLAEIKQAINQASQNLEKSRDMRNHWIRGVSHDLRNPLTLILASTQTLGLQVENQREVDKIESHIHQMENTISSLNMLYLLENPDLKQGMKTINLSALLRQAIADYYNQQTNINLDFHLPDEDCFILGDATLLRRVVDNLVNNSLIHNHQPTITISLNQKKDYCELLIADNGNITPEKILELNQKSRQYDQHGLGVIITKQIIHLHDATITFLYSNPGLICCIKFSTPGKVNIDKHSQ